MDQLQLFIFQIVSFADRLTMNIFYIQILYNSIEL